MSRLARPTAHRTALMRTQVTQLINHERIETTLAKARELRKIADNMITIAKQNDLAARRRAAAILFDESSQKKLFTVLGPRYKERDGGYTRVLRSRLRLGDKAEMAYIEYIDREGELRTPKPAVRNPKRPLREDEKPLLAKDEQKLEE